ncbi:MAG: DUF2096 domain-containing protein [Candidatus Bathyarchaeota archaeon]|nr:DUF2096 domain-containing protein [Candidatus Bathyarchaeota archaeon]
MRQKATSQILEDLLVELQHKNVTIPENIINNLRSARSLMNVVEASQNTRGEVPVKIDEYLSSVEAYLVTEAGKTWDGEKIDSWLRKLEVANCDACATTIIEPRKDNRFVTGVPRDQKWVRVEAIAEIPLEKLEQLATENKLQFREENTKQLVVYGSQDDIKQFIKTMTQQTPKK